MAKVFFKSRLVLDRISVRKGGQEKDGDRIASKAE